MLKLFYLPAESVGDLAARTEFEKALNALEALALERRCTPTLNVQASTDGALVGSVHITEIVMPTMAGMPPMQVPVSAKDWESKARPKPALL